MTFQFTDQHIDDYYRRGYAVFRSILPPSLIEDLRRVTDEGRKQVRAATGPQSQRFQPVGRFDIDQKPFQDYAELPALHDALERLLGIDHFYYGDPNLMGVLIEPEELAWCTNWHRDFRDHRLDFPIDEWNELMLDIVFMNQINCALYKDHCTWVVPGSHLRQNLQRELELFPDRPVPSPNLDGLTNAEAERVCLAYCNSMPGAEQLFLEAGDFAVYRASMWHMGNYLPYSKRATLHDGVFSPRYDEWRARVVGQTGRSLTNGTESAPRWVGMRTPGGGEEYRRYQK